MSDSQSTVGAPLIADLDTLAAYDEREYLFDFLESADRAREPHLRVMDEVWENYIVALPGESYRHWLWPRSTGNVPSFYTNPGTRLKDPETHQILQSLTAQQVGLYFAAPEYISAKPVGSGADYEKARAVQMALQGFLERPGEFRTDYEAILTSNIFGVSIVEVGWETRARQQYVLQPQLDAMGVPSGRKIVPQVVVYRDQPLRRTIDPFDFYPDPVGTGINVDMRGCAKRFEIYEEEARALAQPVDGEPGVYDAQAVERAIARGRDDKGQSTPSGASTRMQDRTVNRIEATKRMRRLVGFEYHGFSPVRRNDGFSWRTITMLNGEIVRSHGLAYIDGKIPFVEFVPMPVPGRFWGLSPASVIRFLQDAADANLMLITDMLINSLYGPLMVQQGFGGDREALRNRHLRQIIEVIDPEKVKGVPVDYQALTHGVDWYGRQKQVMRESSGRTDPVQAIPSTGDKTATEVGELVRLASQRVGMTVQITERGPFPAMGRMIHNRFRQFMGDSEVWVRFTGEPFAFTIDDIDLDVDVRFTGSAFAMSKFQKTQAYTQAIQTIAASTQLIPMMPDLFIRLLRDGMEIGDAEQIVTRAMMAQAMLAQQQQAMQEQAGGAPQPGDEQPNGDGTAAAQTETGLAEREGRSLQ